MVTNWLAARHALRSLGSKLDRPEREGHVTDPAIAICAHDLTTGYRQGSHVRVVHRGLELVLPRGKLTALLGPNGAGKSTLMRTLSGLQPALSGTVWVDGVPLRALSPQAIARRIAVVLTDRVDVGYMTAYALAALGRHPYTRWDGRLTPEDEQIVQEAMYAAGCAGLAARMVAELSDGERQRVMIARALAQQTPIIFLDEPTAFLDLPRRVEIMYLLRNLAHQTGRALLLSTHDLELALRFADLLWLMGGDGTFVTGTPTELLQRGELLRVFSAEGQEVRHYLQDLHQRWQATDLLRTPQ
ncbi:MAG: ABC transporter ATP-binding protein [Anaerolineae bacterium]|nr:ABC transporter ATP-binding protein [Thermoflexales bacterium]MDW8396300.1 ABC transporter ATP-binding protein [Anaerolineae bacterium]